MPKYLFKVNYTLDGFKGVLAKGGSARHQAAQAGAESAGGTVESFYFAFGDTDVYGVADLPDNTAAAAFALTVAASGGASIDTTVLLSPDEVDAAAGKKIGYEPPGS
ncbi:MAG: GYD domain-containing protein [Marmoricola sp.]